MAILSNYSDKKLLILDDIPEMRSSLRSQAGSIGFEKVTVCSNVKDATEALKQSFFDVIICDYYLGSGTDGQQFLEYLRNHDIISRRTLFVMVTAEKNYESVVTAAECLPDEYLLKPFTAESFKIRIERLMEKKERLFNVDLLQDKKRWDEVVTACDQIIATRDRYLADAMRIKGNALLQAQNFEAAAAFYEQVLNLRPMPWAKLGLARAQTNLGNHEASKANLETLISESPQLLAAHDLLGHIHFEQGNTEAALQVLDDASRISPSSLTRQRAIAAVAEDAGDYARVEQALQLVVKKTRNSPLRDSNDYSKLSQAYTANGDAGKALEVIDEAKTFFKEEREQPLLAAVEALAHHQLGHTAEAEAALQRAVSGDLSKLPPAAALTVAKACLATGQVEAGETILKRVVQTNLAAKDVHARVSKIMESHGIADQAEQLIAESVQEIIQLNNDAVRCGKEGRIAEAAEMLTAAANRLPGNVQIVANAAYSLLLDVLQNGIDPQKMDDARRFRQGLSEQSPGHKKLGDIDLLWSKISTKYGESLAP